MDLEFKYNFLNYNDKIKNVLVCIYTIYQDYCLNARYCPSNNIKCSHKIFKTSELKSSKNSLSDKILILSL